MPQPDAVILPAFHAADRTVMSGEEVDGFQGNSPIGIPLLVARAAMRESANDRRARTGEVRDMNEVYFCGKCRRQQQPSQGERCIMCNRITVSWYTDRESEQDALRKWRSING
jgi:hypothetical protein